MNANPVTPISGQSPLATSGDFELAVDSRLSLDGVSSIEQVTVTPRSPEELLAIHGVDPKAMRILEEALAAESLGSDDF